ncbi:GerAB/ArcD/ProY family transporter [Mycoplasmatota bacterium WC44]
MEKSKGKISVRQVMLFFIIAVYTPSIRFVSGYTGVKAKHAAWLVPTVTFIVTIVLIYILNSLLQKYKGLSFMDIIYDITSRFWGKIIIGLYLVWLTILLSLYVRYYAERLVTSIYPNVEIDLFVISIILIVAVIIRSGIVVIARMNEIIFLMFLVIAITLMVLILPTIKIDYLTPISSLNFIPILKGNIGTTSLIYLPYLLFFSHEFSRTKEFFKYGIYAAIFIWIFTTLIIIASIGNLGHDLIGRTPLAFFVVVKQVSLLGIISGFESIFVATWIISDFIIITVFTYSIMNMTKSLFNLKDFKPFINIFLVIIYFVTWILAGNVFELQAFSSDFAAMTNIMMQVGVPIILFTIGKVRRKI